MCGSAVKNHQECNGRVSEKKIWRSAGNTKSASRMNRPEEVRLSEP
jgi:hypothetical protein